jgi:hypothetical protein
LAGFSGFSGARAISGTAVAAKRASGTVASPGFPARWLTAALWQHWAARRGGQSDGGRDGRCRRDLRHARRGKEREKRRVGVLGRRSNSAEGF